MKRGSKCPCKQAKDNYGGAAMGAYFIHENAKECLATIMEHSVLRMKGEIGVKTITSKMEL